MRNPGEILVVSCYELGHQPLAAASALGFLERAGYRPAAIDLAVEPLDCLHPELIAQARLVALSVPMHTALRVGLRAAREIRKLAPETHICFYGLYATLNADYLLEQLADSVIGGEFEEALVELAVALDAGTALEKLRAVGLLGRHAAPPLSRLDFPQPSRDALPPLERYAMLEVAGERRTAAAVEASRGCLHHCRHCPIPAVYAGRFFVVPRAVVLDDIRSLARRGARHITFADPDFLNGPGHSMAIVREMHRELPQLTFDATIKVEHILEKRELFDELRECGCLFVVSAVESLSDDVLGHLEKGHTRRDVFRALEILRAAEITMRPSLVAFTPWTRLSDFVELLDWVDEERLADQIDPVQFSIRLLVPPGSLLIEHEGMQPYLLQAERENFSYGWRHPDPRMDRLHEIVSRIVHDAARRDESTETTYRRIRDAAFDISGRVATPQLQPFLPSRATGPAPRLTEPWFC